MTESDRPGYTRLTRDTRNDRNLLGLPDGPCFPWSRAFRWDLMPWNRNLRRHDRELRRHGELIHLLEAAAGTIGVVAREAGFEFNSAFTGTANGAVSHAVLYEALPSDIAARYPGLASVDEQFCLDLWITWCPELGRLDVVVPDLHGGDCRMPDRAELQEPARQPVTDKRRLRPQLQAWSEALELWFQAQETS